MQATQLFVLVAGIMTNSAHGAGKKCKCTWRTLNLFCIEYEDAVGRLSLTVYLSLSLPIVGVAMITGTLCCHLRTDVRSRYASTFFVCILRVIMHEYRTRYPSDVTDSSDTSTIKAVHNDLYTSLVWVCKSAAFTMLVFSVVIIDQLFSIDIYIYISFQDE